MPKPPPPPPPTPPPVTGKGPGVTSGNIRDLRQGATPGKAGYLGSARKRASSRAGTAPPPPKPMRTCPTNTDVKPKTVKPKIAKPYFEVDINSTGESASEASSSEGSAGSSSYEYTYETASEYESESEKATTRKVLHEFDARVRARELGEQMARQDKKAADALRRTAKGDLSACDELEEEWESYNAKGGHKDRQSYYDDQRFAGFEEHLKKQLHMPPEASEHDFAKAQWDLLLKNALDATFSHLKQGEDLKIGVNNQKDLDGQAYANMASSAIYKIWAQGDLKLDHMPDSLIFSDSKYKDWRPICDAETLNLWECDIYLFSDSVLKLGKKRRIGQ